MSYDPSLQDDKDKVRLLIGDTGEEEFLSDSEIEFFISQEADLYLSASACALAIASQVAKDVDFRFSTLWQDASEAYKHFTDLAERLKTKSGENITGIEFHASGDRVNKSTPIFRLGMHDN